MANIALGLSWNQIAILEEQGIGLQWHNLFDGALPHQGFPSDGRGGLLRRYSVGAAIVILLIDCLLYLLIAVYIQNVWPG